MKAIVLSAGYATRLYPLTLNKPKHLLEVAGKTILDRIIKKIEEIKGADTIFVVTNAKFIEYFEEWARNAKTEIPVVVLNDETTSNDDRLGAIGDIKFVIEKEKINDDLLVVAGDNLFEFGLNDFLKVYYEHKTNVLAVYDIKSLIEAKKFGVTAVNNEHKLIEFEEKPLQPKSTLIATACYFFPKNKLNLLHKYIEEGNKADRSGDFIKWLMENDTVYCYVSKEKWFDIGSRELLKEAEEYYREKEFSV